MSSSEGSIKPVELVAAILPTVDSADLRLTKVGHRPDTIHGPAVDGGFAVSPPPNAEAVAPQA